MIPMLKQARANLDDISAFTDAIKVAALIMTIQGVGEAARKAEAMRMPQRVVEGFTKAAVAGGSTGGVGISSFGPSVAGAFMQASRNVGFADEVAQFSMKFPDKSGRVMIYSAMSVASSVGEGAAKTLKAINMGEAEFDPVKAGSLVVLTRALIDAIGSEGLRVLGDELKRGTSNAADTAFLTALSGNSTDKSVATSNWAAFLTMFEEMLRLVDLGAASKPTNRMTLLDATGLATSMGEIELRSSENASIEMVDSSSQSSATSVGQAQMVSMFQTGSRALLAERTISVRAVRTNCFVHLTGVKSR